MPSERTAPGRNKYANPARRIWLNSGKSGIVIIGRLCYHIHGNKKQESRKLSMYFGKKLVRTAAVTALAAFTLYGSTREINIAREMSIASESGAGQDTLLGSLGNLNDKETIYFWYTDDNMTSLLNSAAVSFGEQEGVRVLPVLVSDGTYLETINEESLHGEQAPDVYLISNDSLEKAYLAGLAGEIRDEDGFCSADGYPDAALDAVSYHGKYVAYPYYYDTVTLLYNDTYFREWAAQQAQKELSGENSDGEEAENGSETAETTEYTEEQLTALTEQYYTEGVPSTVDDILNIADGYDPPEGLEYIMKWDLSDILYNYWLVGNYMIVGGDTGDDESSIDIYNGATLQGLLTYQNLNQFFSIEADEVDYDSVLEEFIAGKIMFTIVSSDAVAVLENAQADGTLAYEYAFVTMPDVSDELASRSMSSTVCVAVNGYSEHKDLANRFARYLVTYEADSLYDRIGKLPARSGIVTDALAVFEQEYAESVSMPKMMETGNYWMQLEVLFSKVWNGEDADTLLSELADQINAQIME